MTSPTKHTPGPWHVFLGNRGYQPGIYSPERSIVIYGTEDEYLGIRGRTDEERLANAHLIAAAPELLEALDEAIEILVFAFEKGALSDDLIKQLCIDPWGRLNDMKSAAQKARGGQQ